ncbi:hypothetical protein G7Y89_g12837 [Cudoniella acicularis]|uniref:Uncharacterized protein n=1 Tax=Cudoniella acicularis TaxID=354080 RepID=A0A8H4RBV3_9HELO|nr:hypothetical protein G7Y89_g12837 [Cudoniella acicularis]
MDASNGSLTETSLVDIGDEMVTIGNQESYEAMSSILTEMLTRKKLGLNMEDALDENRYNPGILRAMKLWLRLTEELNEIQIQELDLFYQKEGASLAAQMTMLQLQPATATAQFQAPIATPTSTMANGDIVFYSTHANPPVRNPTTTTPFRVFEAFRPSYFITGGFNINPNYKGDIDSNFEFRCKSCPEDENCAVWITNIPAKTTIKQIFDVINDDRVFAFHKFLHTKIMFDLVDLREWVTYTRQNVVELHFCCIRGQSRAAFKCLATKVEGFGMKDLYEFSYGLDPCVDLVLS